MLGFSLPDPLLPGHHHLTGPKSFLLAQGPPQPMLCTAGILLPPEKSVQPRRRLAKGTGGFLSARRVELSVRSCLWARKNHPLGRRNGRWPAREPGGGLPERGKQL